MWFPEKVTGNMEFVTVAKMQGRNVSKFPSPIRGKSRNNKFWVKAVTPQVQVKHFSC